METAENRRIMITEIGERFYRITLPMPYRLSHIHAYAVVVGRDITLFDTGMAMPGAYEKLEEDLQSIGLSVASIRDIYLTHVHHDHCGLSGLLQEKSKAGIHLSADAWQALTYFQQTDYLLSRARLFYIRQGMLPAEMETIMEDIEEVSRHMPRFPATTFLRNNEIRQCGNRFFEVVFTPGHAEGHVCFFFREEGILLAGDHILPYILPSFCPNVNNDEVFRPLHSYLESLHAIEKLPIKVLYPGHGNSITGIEERIRDIRDQLTVKKQVYLNNIDNLPKTSYAVSGAATATRDDWDKFMALNETCVYVQELEKEGAIKESIVDGVIFYTAV